MIERFFRPGFKVLRHTTTKDALGGPVLTWSDHLTNVHGKLWALRGDQRLSADKHTLFADYKFATAFADIREDDRLVDPDGNEYEIKFAPDRMRPDGTGHMELDCELIR